MARRPREFDNFPESLDGDWFVYRAVIKHWVDGDTVDLLIDLGLRKYAYEAVRLAGFDAPEIYGRKEPGELERGRAAREYALRIAPPGTPVRLRTYKDRQSFNRYVGSITLADGSDVAQKLIDAGHERRV